MLDVATKIAIQDIRLDGGTQPRDSIDETVVQDYAQSMMEGAIFPPVTVYYDGSSYWLADGFHRVHAAMRQCRDEIETTIKQGTRRDAVLHSVGANATHGLQRKNSDKRRSVETLLNDAEWVMWSDREIARQCGVSNRFVTDMRNDLSVNGSQIEAPRVVQRNGTTYTMNTANIGVTREEAESVLQQEPLPAIHPTQIMYTPRSLEETEYRYVPPVTPVILAREETLTAPPFVTVEPAKSSTLTALQSSESNEWYTPAQYVDAARSLMGGIDIDPASNVLANEIIQASCYYDASTNGLDKLWTGRAWLNPPYGFTEGRSNQEVWTSRLIEQYQSGITTEAVLLVNANTEAKWFQPLYDYLICFTNHRIRFYSQNGDSSQPTQGNALVYFGCQRQRFIELFSVFGVVLERVVA